MGLDMYAARRLNVRRFESTPVKERYSVKIEYGGKPLAGIQSDRISAVEEEVKYWRKANHIHAWFVDNVQDGKDDCKDYYVSLDKLRQLLADCEKVIQASKLVEGTISGGTVFDKAHPKGLAVRQPGKVIEDATVAKELLPRRLGFFFGNYEYDEGYLKDVVETRDWAARMVADCENGVHGNIYYSSSW